MNIDIQQTSLQQELSREEDRRLGEMLHCVWCSRCGWCGFREECRTIGELETQGLGCKPCGWPISTGEPSLYEALPHLLNDLMNWRVWLAGLGLALVIIGAVLLAPGL